MELMHEPEPTAEEKIKAANVLEFLLAILRESVFFAVLLTTGWLISTGKFSWFIPASETMYLQFLLVGFFLSAVSNVVAVVVRAYPRQKVFVPFKEQAHDKPENETRKINPVVAAIGLVFITGLFITLFFGYLIMRNAMLGV